MPTTFLVIGSRGLLGSSLVPYLKSLGEQVISVSRGREADIRADFTLPGDANRHLAKIKPNTIVNLAALTDVDQCERDRHLAHAANVLIVENIVAWMSTGQSASHLVQISTDQLYDGLGPHTEDDVRLTNAYAESKFEAENAAQSVWSTILRTNFFGPSLSAGRASISDWIRASLRSKHPITVFEDILFSPLSIGTLVRMIALVASKREKGVFNLGSRDGMSKADFAYALADVLDLPTGLLARGLSDGVQLRAYRPKDMRMDSTRFEHAFSLKLPTLRQEIELMREVYANASG